MAITGTNGSPATRTRVTFQLPAEDRNELRRLARERDLNESQIVRRALRPVLEHARREREAKTLA